MKKKEKIYYQCNKCKLYYSSLKEATECKCPYGTQEFGNPEFHKIIDELKQIHSMKSFDYGKEKDPLSNLRSSEEFGIDNWIGAVIRANDKMARIKTFANKKQLKNEPIEDALKDLANYAILALVLYREKINGNQSQS